MANNVPLPYLFCRTLVTPEGWGFRNANRVLKFLMEPDRPVLAIAQPTAIITPPHQRDRLEPV